MKSTDDLTRDARDLAGELGKRRWLKSVLWTLKLFLLGEIGRLETRRQRLEKLTRQQRADLERIQDLFDGFDEDGDDLGSPAVTERYFNIVKEILTWDERYHKRFDWLLID